ncbi:MAG: polyphosphate kinase 1 [Armatimonadota bacterium]|nr:polyphosphate kinase 1 [Armatimonadota bacterium]
MSASRKSAKTPKAQAELNRPELFINRELSWLEFNQRVLEEAQDATNPLLERLKFLSIVTSNLDEFFEIRVAGLQQKAESQPQRTSFDGLTAEQTLEAIAARVQRMVRDQYQCYRDEIVPGLAAQGIDLQTVEDLTDEGRMWIAEFFQREVFPVLTPLAIDPAHPFPQLLNKSLNLAVVLSIIDVPGQFDGLRRDEQHEMVRLGVVQVPRVLPRLVAVPSSCCPAGHKSYVFLSSIISEHIGQLFPGLHVQGCYAFRVTRNSDLYVDDDEADNLLEAVREQLQRRRRGDAVRLEVQRGCDRAVVDMLLRTFELDPIDLFEVDGPINLTRLMAVYNAERRPALIDAPFTPATPRVLRQIESAEDLFATIRHEDILFHHPYESFKGVIDFIRMAAEDPQVLAIKQTLYRTSANSPIMRALMHAAANGKQVTALVEVKARFDEENNIQWARAMEEAGVHVLYGLVGLKTHCKLALVVRREDSEIRRYVHLGTGNYNEVTARLYTDLGLLTARPDIGEEAARVFNLLTGMSQFPNLQKLFMAPSEMQQGFRRLVEREIQHAGRKRHKKRPHIIVKMNSLEDPEIILDLYRASQAGVRIDLIVRGICCLRPGVPGVSDNIRVRSIVDRFLEHSRIFYFSNNGDEEIYIGSADWMRRNFHQRIEVAFPVEDAALKTRLKDEILFAALNDNVKARVLKMDGSYQRVKRRAHDKPLRSQMWLLEQTARRDAEPTPNFLDSRPVAAPVAPSFPTLRPSPFTVASRSGPPNFAATSADGRAGTQADPVLQSLQQSLIGEGTSKAAGVELAGEEAQSAVVGHDDV